MLALDAPLDERVLGLDRDRPRDAALGGERPGASATTLTDLTVAMGIARPSLYNAFGDKRSLFLAALDRYAEAYAPMLAALEAETDARAAVRAFLLGAAQGLGDAGQPVGCLRVAHTAALPADEPELALALARHHRALESAFEARLVRAQREGQLGPAEPAGRLAAFFVGTLAAMSVRARVDRDPDVLAGIAERAVRAWP